MEKAVVELTKNEVEILIDMIKYAAESGLTNEEIKLYEKLKKLFTK